MFTMIGVKMFVGVRPVRPSMRALKSSWFITLVGVSMGMLRLLRLFDPLPTSRLDGRFGFWATLTVVVTVTACCSSIASAWVRCLTVLCCSSGSAFTSTLGSVVVIGFTSRALSEETLLHTDLCASKMNSSWFFSSCSCWICSSLSLGFLPPPLFTFFSSSWLLGCSSSKLGGGAALGVTTVVTPPCCQFDESMLMYVLCFNVGGAKPAWFLYVSGSSTSTNICSIVFRVVGVNVFVVLVGCNVT